MIAKCSGLPNTFEQHLLPNGAVPVDACTFLQNLWSTISNSWNNFLSNGAAPVAVYTFRNDVCPQATRGQGRFSDSWNGFLLNGVAPVAVCTFWWNVRVWEGSEGEGELGMRYSDSCNDFKSNGATPIPVCALWEDFCCKGWEWGFRTLHIIS